MLKAKSFLMCVALFAAICGTVSGQRNETLFQAQKKLTELGYSPGSPDGLSGARTEIAIKKFQVDNKLSPTGTLDRVTLQKLLGSIGGTLSTKTVPPAKDLDRVFVDGTSTLMQRKVETRSLLAMRQFMDSSGAAGAGRVTWVFMLERPTDQVAHLAIVPFPLLNTSWKASVLSTYGEDQVTTKALPNSVGSLAFERFEDVTSVLGVGSEIRFDAEQWVEFYGERFRNGGIRISADKVDVMEGTERLIDKQVMLFQKGSWVRTQVIPVIATIKPIANEGLTVEAFQENADWTRASAEGTAAAYKTFLKVHPDSHFVQAISGTASYAMALPTTTTGSRSLGPGITITSLSGVRPPTSTRVVGADAATISEVLVTMAGRVFHVSRAKAEAWGLLQELGGGAILKTKETGPATLYVAREGDSTVILAIENGSLRAQSSQPTGDTTANDFQGLLSLSKGDYDDAIALFNKAINVNPDDERALNGRGIAKVSKRDFDGAIVDCTKGIELKPDDPIGFKCRGLARLAKKDLDGAITDFTKVIEYQPGDAVAYKSRGNAKRGKGDFDGATADQIRAIEITKPGLKTADDFKRDAKENLYAKKDFETAIAGFTKAVQLKPDDPESYEIRGFAKAQERNYDGAISDLNKAIDLNHDYSEAYSDRCFAKTGKDDLDGAIADCTKAIELKPNSPNAYMMRGSAKWTKGDSTAGDADLNRAVELGASATTVERLRHK